MGTLQDLKQASRDQDAEDLAAGRVTAEELWRVNPVFAGIPSKPRFGGRSDCPDDFPARGLCRGLQEAGPFS